MATRTNHNSKILDEIHRQFSKQRRIAHGRQSPIPGRLRRLALSALESGHTPKQVAQAAQISRQSVANWQRMMSRQAMRPAAAPVELKLIDGFRAQADATVVATATTIQSEPNATARIMLRSGIIVELPASVLSTEMLLALNGSMS